MRVEQTELSAKSKTPPGVEADALTGTDLVARPGTQRHSNLQEQVKESESGDKSVLIVDDAAANMNHWQWEGAAGMVYD